MSSQDLNRRRRKIWFWGILALGILFILCLWSHSRSIPRDIEGRVREALTVGGFDPGLLSAVDGRDVSLAGEIDPGSDRNKLVAIARSVRGVRRVSDNLTLIELGDARFHLKSSAAQIILQGVMPDKAAVDKTVAAASGAYGAENVTNQLTVQSRLREPSWLAGLAEVIAELPEIDAVEIEAGPNGVRMSGVVESTAIRGSLSAKAAELFGNQVALEARLEVKPQPVPLGQAHISIARSDGTLVLKGELADQHSIDKIVMAARQLVGVDTVDNQMTVGENIVPADWIDGLIGLFPALEDIPDARVVIGGEGLLIGGTLDADEKRSALLQNARKAAGQLALQDRIVLVLPKQSARLSIRMSEDKLTLSGTLPDPSDIDRVLAAVHNQFAAGQLINSLNASDSVNDPDWLDGVLQLFGYLTNVAQGGIEADDRGALLVGVVADQDQRSFIARRAKALLGDMSIDNRIEVKPTAPSPSVPAAEPLASLPVFPPLHFKHDSIELVEASQRLLGEVVDLLKRYPDLRLAISAHTDSAGDEVYNQDLSERRAQDMAQILTAAGIEAGRLIPRGHGELQPIAENTTPAGPSNEPSHRIKGARVKEDTTMGYLIGEILICLILAALIGAVVAWFLRGVRSRARENELLDELKQTHVKLDSAEGELRRQEAALGDLRSKLEAQAQTLEHRDEKLSSVEAALAKRDESMAELQSDLAQLQDEKEVEIASLREHIGTLEPLQGQLDDSQSERNRLRAELQALTDKLQTEIQHLNVEFPRPNLKKMPRSSGWLVNWKRRLSNFAPKLPSAIPPSSGWKVSCGPRSTLKIMKLGIWRLGSRKRSGKLNAWPGRSGKFNPFWPKFSSAKAKWSGCNTNCR